MASEEESWDNTGVVPLDLSISVAKDSAYPAAVNAFGHVFRGTLTIDSTNKEAVADVKRPVTEGDRLSVAIRIIRPVVEAGQQKSLERRLKREIALWHQLRHENILPLYGISQKFDNLTATISPWMNNGNIMEYLERVPNADRYELLRGIASGLAYLHGHNPKIFHGDIKPENILINDSGAPYLHDFLISAVYSDQPFWVTATKNARGTLRYMAPELITGRAIRPTAASDAHAYAMTCVPILTGKPPFEDIREVAVMFAVTMQGLRPTKPEESIDGARIPDEIWELVSSCWKENPEARPPMHEVSGKLAEICSTRRAEREKEKESSREASHQSKLTRVLSMNNQQVLSIPRVKSSSSAKSDRRTNRADRCIIS